MKTWVFKDGITTFVIADMGHKFSLFSLTLNMNDLTKPTFNRPGDFSSPEEAAKSVHKEMSPFMECPEDLSGWQVIEYKGKDITDQKSTDDFIIWLLEHHFNIR